MQTERNAGVVGSKMQEQRRDKRPSHVQRRGILFKMANLENCKMLAFDAEPFPDTCRRSF